MKSIFLDVDGTLVADKGHVPESAQLAIQKARQQGHKIILCTGRAMSEIYPNILEIQFDGIVACGGNYVTTFEEVLYERMMTLKDLKEIYAYFDAHTIDYYAETNAGLFMSKGCGAALDRLMDHLRQDPKHEDIVHAIEKFKSFLIQGQSLLREDVTKISFMGSTHPFSALREQFEGRYELFEGIVPIFGDNSGEISLLGTDKTVGMKIISDHFGIDQAHTIAIGDGNNDISMLQYVAIGVAMENATEQLKQVATHVTGHVNEDGLAQAFEFLGLLG